MHLRADIPDMLLYFPNALSWSALTPEQGYITGIALRIISTNQTQQCRFSGTIISAKSPLLTTFHTPIQLFQDSPFTVTDTHFIQIYHMVGMIKAITIRKSQDTFFFLLWEHTFGDRLATGKISFQRNFITAHTIFYRNYVRNQRRYIICLWKYQNYLQTSHPYKFAKQCMKLVTCLGVKSDKRIIHYQHTRVTQQSLGQLKFT